jgi:hypothetical protein
LIPSLMCSDDSAPASVRSFNIDAAEMLAN